MLRIECESCHAPYQVDERRVPPHGLKMRCPKCGHTFSVASPNPPADVGPAPKTLLKGGKMTMVGLGGGGDEPGLPATKAGLPKAPPVPPKVAPRAAPAPAPSPPSPKPPMVDIDLPAARPAPPKNVPPRPAPPRPQPIAAKPPAPLPNFGADLPAVRTTEREKYPSLPAALGSVDDFPAPRAKPAPAAPINAAATLNTSSAFGEIDLPAVASDLPAMRPTPPKARVQPAEVSFELDPPQVKPLPKRDDLELDLGPPAADLPAPLVGLPSLAASLPSRKAEPAFGEIDLPSLDTREQLPIVASALPAVANVMPVVGQQLPSTVDDSRLLPQSSGAPPSLDFGEVDLGPLSAPPPKPQPPQSALREPPQNAFAELDLGAADLRSVPPSQPAAPPPPPQPPQLAPQAPTPFSSPPKAGNALAYGELDLGGPAEAEPPPPASPMQTESHAQPSALREAPLSSSDELSLPRSSVPAPRPSGGNLGSTEVSLPIQTTSNRRDRDAMPAAPSRLPRVMFVLLLLALAGGGALHLTKHGAFGYLTLGDMLHQKDYKAFADSQSAAARTRATKDTYPETRGSVDDLLAAHWKMPRASGLSAYAVFAELSYETRFGPDVDRNAKAKMLLSELMTRSEVPYLNVALAAQAAVANDFAKARGELEAASKRDAGDPIQRDIALLRGEVELRAHDAKAAKAAFDTALKLGATAQAHYGLARAANIAHDWPTVGSECNATLTASPHHPGALVLRAMQRYMEKGNDTDALADLTEVIEGPAKPFAASSEIAQALANRGRIFLASGRAGDARTAFDASLKLDNRNVDALIGQGTVFYQESRFTEALTRFDTALQSRPDDEVGIAYDALAKIKLERLKEAKDQLVAARTKFPRSMRITFALAQAESALGNVGDAEKDLRQAIDFTQAKDATAVEPYIGLATLLVAHNRDKDAQTVIEDAKTKLPDEAPVAVAFGEFDATQGKYEDAVAHFRHALELAPTSLSTHFKLGVTYRHMRKTDLASTEFDQVLAIDKDYPGLALERGLLFEESGEIDRALEQFKNALARAPEDSDLQLRVGAAYVASNRGDDALPMLRKVLDKRPTSAEANHYLGRALFLKDGSTNEAMRYLKRAVELDPNRPEYHLYVARAANESSPAQLGLAQDEIDKALALDQLLADAYWQRGVLERKRLAVEDALKDLRHALELRPARIEAYATIAECYEDKNDPGTAIVNWQKAIAGNARMPYWHYRYGKLLLEHGNANEASTHLSAAVDEALKQEARPPWLAPAEFSGAEALNRSGKRVDAITMYRRFLEIAPMNDPDRRDAIKALSNLGETYRPGGGH